MQGAERYHVIEHATSAGLRAADERTAAPKHTAHNSMPKACAARRGASSTNHIGRSRFCALAAPTLRSTHACTRARQATRTGKASIPTPLAPPSVRVQLPAAPGHDAAAPSRVHPTTCQGAPSAAGQACDFRNSNSIPRGFSTALIVHKFEKRTDLKTLGFEEIQHVFMPLGSGPPAAMRISRLCVAICVPLAPAPSCLPLPRRGRTPFAPLAGTAATYGLPICNHFHGSLHLLHIRTYTAEASAMAPPAPAQRSMVKD